MPEETSLLQQVFAETGVQLDRIIDTYRRGVTPPHPETIVWYSNDTLSSFEIEGELGRNSIPDKENAVKVEIGTDVLSVGNYAFSNCSGLTSVTIPNSVTEIGSAAFSNCSNLTSVTIGNGVTNIKGYVFQNCSGLMSIIIPNSVTSIGGGVFGGCSGLTSITIPDGVTSIGSSAFTGCLGLTSVSFSGKTIAQVQGMSGYSWNLNTGCTIYCTDGTISQ